MARNYGGYGVVAIATALSVQLSDRQPLHPSLPRAPPAPALGFGWGQPDHVSVIVDATSRDSTLPFESPYVYLSHGPPSIGSGRARVIGQYPVPPPIGHRTARG